MDKPLDNRAWFMVAPVLVIVAFTFCTAFKVFNIASFCTKIK